MKDFIVWHVGKPIQNCISFFPQQKSTSSCFFILDLPHLSNRWIILAKEKCFLKWILSKSVRNKSFVVIKIWKIGANPIVSYLYFVDSKYFDSFASLLLERIKKKTGYVSWVTFRIIFRISEKKNRRQMLYLNLIVFDLFENCILASSRPQLCLIFSNSSSQAAHLLHCDRNHGHQCHPDLGLRQPWTSVLLYNPVPSQTVRQWLPGSRWRSHNQIQHRRPQPLLRVRVPRHGRQQRRPGASQQHRGHPHKRAGALVASSSRPGAYVEPQHHAGPVGASGGAQRANPGIPSLLQLGARFPAQRVAEAQHGRQPAHHHLRPHHWHHLQPEGPGLHVCGRRASLWSSADQDPAGRWEPRTAPLYSEHTNSMSDVCCRVVIILVLLAQKNSASKVQFVRW